MSLDSRTNGNLFIRSWSETQMLTQCFFYWTLLPIQSSAVHLSCDEDKAANGNEKEHEKYGSARFMTEH